MTYRADNVRSFGIGNGRQLMRKVALVFAVLTVPLAAASQATAKLAMAKAVYAVKEEIGNEWTLLTTVPKSLKVPGARASVSCKELSTTRFRCSFTATNSVGYQAYVKAG